MCKMMWIDNVWLSFDSFRNFKLATVSIFMTKSQSDRNDKEKLSNYLDNCWTKEGILFPLKNRIIITQPWAINAPFKFCFRHIFLRLVFFSFIFGLAKNEWFHAGIGNSISILIYLLFLVWKMIFLSFISSSKNRSFMCGYNVLQTTE